MNQIDEIPVWATINKVNMENKKKILGFCTIHYSGDYFRESLLSVVNYVDKMVIAYSHKPSQGFSSNTPCPDTKEYILQIAQEVLGDKLIWDEAESYPSETHHRDVKNKYAEGFDAILTVDSDEVMVGIPEALEYAFTNEEEHFGIKGYVNFFRSFSWACFDSFRPVRITVLGRNNAKQNLECPLIIYHFSLCQRPEVMKYKYQNFGHASEIRPNYLQDIFYKWTPGCNIKQLHPVSLQIWDEAIYFDKKQLPTFMLAHPNFFKEIID